MKKITCVVVLFFFMFAQKTYGVLFKTNTVYYNIALLEQLGQGECSICSEEEIMNIMSVAINRVKDSRFPNNLKDVLYEDNQFHGMFRIETISKKVSNCAKIISVKGSVIDSDILYFMIPKKAQKHWYNKLKDHVRIKSEYHHFYASP